MAMEMELYSFDSKGLHFLQNAKEHATLSVGASVERGVRVVATEDHENRAADRGCCVSACWASSFILESSLNGVEP